jgi:hypothetical protein
MATVASFERTEDLVVVFGIAIKIITAKQKLFYEYTRGIFL